MARPTEAGITVIQRSGTAAGNSVKSTIPYHIMHQLNLKPKDQLRWDMVVQDGELKIIVTPLK